MKKLTSILMLAVMAAFLGHNASAQGKYGADSAECIKYLSYYQEYYKQKNYDSALPNWRKAYSICPATASQNLFVHGSTLINREINKNRKNAAYFNALVDTLLTLQDHPVPVRQPHPDHRRTGQQYQGRHPGEQPPGRDQPLPREQTLRR